MPDIMHFLPMEKAKLHVYINLRLTITVLAVIIGMASAWNSVQECCTVQQVWRPAQLCNQSNHHPAWLINTIGPLCKQMETPYLCAAATAHLLQTPLTRAAHVFSETRSTHDQNFPKHVQICKVSNVSLPEKTIIDYSST